MKNLTTLTNLIEENNIKNPTIIKRGVTMQSKFFAIMFCGLKNSDSDDFVHDKIIEKVMQKNKINIILHEYNEPELKWLGFVSKQQFKNFKSDISKMFEDFDKIWQEKSTKQIFKTLLNIKKIAEHLVDENGNIVPRPTVSTWKRRAEANEMKIDLIEKILERNGFSVITEKTWQMPLKFKNLLVEKLL